MSAGKRTALLVACLLVWAAACGEDDDAGEGEAPCDAEGLAEALAAARAGQVVHLGACEVTGAFTVPAGVALEGVGLETVVHAPDDGTALTLAPGDGTRLARLAIESGGVAAVVAEGAGRVELSDVSVTVTRGIGVGAEGLDALVASRVAVVGPVTLDNAGALVPAAAEPWFDPAETGTHGLALVRVGAVTLEDVTAAGFAEEAVLIVQDDGQTTAWTGGSATGSVAAGLLEWGGSAVLDAVSFSDNRRGPLVRSYGAVFGQGAVIETHAVRAEANEGVGLFQGGGASADHEDLVGRANAFGAVWVQETDGCALHGAGTELYDNTLVGLMAVSSHHVTVSDAHVHDTYSGTQGGVELADGMQFLETDFVELRDLLSENSERIQIFFDQGGGDPQGLVIDGVTVNGTGDQLGCIGQNGQFAPGAWDAGMTRLGSAEALDEAFEASGDQLDLGSIIGPQELPDASNVRDLGLSALLQR